MALDSVINSEGLRQHWQGHRKLSRRVIEAFPEDKLFTFSVGSMRPFGRLATEMVSMAPQASEDWQLASGPQVISCITPERPPQQHSRKCSRFGTKRHNRSTRCGLRFDLAVFRRSTQHSDSTKDPSTTSCSTGLTTRSTIAGRGTSTFALSESSRRHFMCELDESRLELTRPAALLYCLWLTSLQLHWLGILNCTCENSF